MRRPVRIGDGNSILLACIIAETPNPTTANPNIPNLKVQTLQPQTIAKHKAPCPKAQKPPNSKNHKPETTLEVRKPESDSRKPI